MSSRTKGPRACPGPEGRAAADTVGLSPDLMLPQARLKELSCLQFWAGKQLSWPCFYIFLGT